MAEEWSTIDDLAKATGPEGTKPFNAEAPVDRAAAPTWGDYGRTAAAATKSLGSGAIAGARYVAELMGADEKADYLGTIQAGADKSVADSHEAMSKAGRSRLEAAVNSAEFWEHWVSSTMMKATGMLPATVASIIPGALLARGMRAVAATAATGATIQTSQTLDDFYQKVDAMSDAERQEASDFYAGLRTSMDEKSARARHNQEMLGLKPAIIFAISSAAQAVGPAATIVNRGVVGAAGKGLAARTAQGALGGTAGEMAEEGSSEALKQHAWLEGGAQKTFDADKLVSTILEAGFMGGALGGVAGAVTGGKSAPKVEREPDVVAPTKVEVVEPGAPNAEESVALASSASPPPVVPKAPDVTPGEVTPLAEQGVAPAGVPPDVAAASGRLSNPEVTPEVTPTPGATASVPFMITRAMKAELAKKGYTPADIKTMTPDQARAALAADPVVSTDTLGTPDPILAPPDVAAASDRIAAAPDPAAPRAPRIFRAQDDAALKVDRLAREAQAAAKPQLVEAKASTGKNWTKKELAKREADAATAKTIFDESAPADASADVTPESLHARVTDIVARAEAAGIKLSAIKAYEGTSDHMVYLREAADLKKTLDKKNSPADRRNAHIASFLGREYAARGGDFSIMRDERRAEGEMAKRVAQGNVEAMASAHEPAINPEDVPVSDRPSGQPAVKGELTAHEDDGSPTPTRATGQFSAASPEERLIAKQDGVDVGGFEADRPPAPVKAGAKPAYETKAEELRARSAALRASRLAGGGKPTVTPKVKVPAAIAAVQERVAKAAEKRIAANHGTAEKEPAFRIETKKQSIARQVKEADERLLGAGEQLRDGNQVETVAQFHEYGKKWGVDTHKEMAAGETAVSADVALQRAIAGQRHANAAKLRADRATVAEWNKKAAAAARGEIDAAAAKVAAPTEAQKEAGNYAKGHVSVQGLPVTIETRKGMIRKGKDADGKEWEVKAPDHYGYVKRTEGADGDHVDVYVGPHPDSPHVFLFDQHHVTGEKAGKFDEHKAMVGYKDATDAMAAYEKAFSDGRGFDRIGLIKPMTMDEFKAWLKHDDTTKPIAEMDTEVVRAHARSSAEPVQYQHGAKPSTVQPLYSTTVREVLKSVKFDHLEGPAKDLIPFLTGKMARLVSDMPVHLVSEAEMAKFNGPARKGKVRVGAMGMWVPHRANGKHADYILLNADALKTGDDFAHTMVHETVHAVMARELNKNPDFEMTIRALAEEVHAHIGNSPFNQLRKLMGNDPEMPDFARYAFTDAHEFLAEAFSNQAFQQLLSETPLSPYLAERIGLGAKIKPTMWDYFMASIKKVLRGFGVPEGSFSALEGALRIGKTLIDAAENNARRVDPMDTANVRPRALKAAELKERIADARTNTGGRLRGWQDWGSSYIMVGERAEPFLPGAKKVVEFRAMMEREKARILEKEGGAQLTRDIAAYEREHGTAELTKMAELGFDASNSNVNLGGRANDHLGKDKTAGWQAKARLPDLERRFKALPAAGQELLQRAGDFFKKVQNDIALQDIKNILKVAGVDEPGLAERIHTTGLTDADKAKFKTQTVVNALDEARELKAIDGMYLPFRRYGEHVVNSYHEVVAPKGAIKIGDDTVQFTDTKKGSDTKARRAALAYVKGQDLRHTGTKKVWVDKNDPTKIVDGSHVDAVRAYRVKFQRQSTEFFETEAQARRVEEGLRAGGEMEQVDGVRKRSDYAGQGANALSGQMHTVMSALEKQDRFKAMTFDQRAAVRQTINEASVRVLGSTRLQSTFQQRRNVAGYSADLGRVTADYARAATGYLAKLRFQPRIDDAFAELQKYNDAHKYESSDRTIRRDELMNELRKRTYDEVPSNAETTFGKVTRRLLQISRLDKLAGVSFHVINSQEPWTTSLPVIGGRHGFIAAARTLGEAYNLIGARGGVIAGLKDTARAFTKDNGFTDYLAMFKHEINTSPAVGGAKAKRLSEVMDYLDNRGMYAEDAVFEVAKYADPAQGRLLRGLDRADLMANQVGNAVEKINRTVTALTAYELEFKKNGGNHEAAMAYAYETTHATMGDYSGWNSAPIFKSNAGMLALQFKKFAHKTYYLLGNTLRGTIAGDPEAAKQFIGLMVTHATVAGALGLPLEPFKVALLAANALGVTGFTYQDFETLVRSNAADLLGQKGGEIFSRGITRAIGIDTASRQGWNSLLTYGEPKDAAKVQDLKAWVFDTVAGAPAGWVLDQIRMTQALGKGDYAKAAELFVPVKGLTDAWKAYTGLEPKRDDRGRVTRPGYSAYDAAVKSIGFTPSSEAENYEKRARFADQSRRAGLERSTLINNWVTAKPGDKAAAMKAAQDWSKTQPLAVRIQVKDMVAAAAKRAKEGDTGALRPTKQNAHILNKLVPVYGQ